MLTVRRINDFGQWQSLAAEWGMLIERCPRATPFQRPEWLLPWWRQFGSGELAVLVCEANGRLVGLLPAFIHEWNERRQVTLIGSGVTDYLDLTAESGWAAECAALAFEWLRENRRRWDVCDWQDLSGDSPLLSANHETPAEIEPYLPGAAAPLPINSAEYHSRLPQRLRRTIRVSAKRLEATGQLEFDTLSSDDDASALDALFRLHQERWAARGGPQSMLDSKPVQRFLADATKELSARGMVRLYVMRFGGEIAAVIYGIKDRGRLYGYICGMDPELGRFSPGSLILNYAITDAIREGVRVWDFLRGQEEYKFQWGAQKIPKYRIRLQAVDVLPNAHARESAVT